MPKPSREAIGLPLGHCSAIKVQEGVKVIFWGAFYCVEFGDARGLGPRVELRS